MKKLITFSLLLALALPMAAVEGDQVMYAGGTLPSSTDGALGRLDTTSEPTLIFESSGTKISIPYADIQSFDIRQKSATILESCPESRLHF